MAKKLTAIQRRSLRHEGRTWDGLTDADLARLFDEAPPVRIRLRRPPPKSLTVALHREMLNGLQRVARRKQVHPRQLAAMWIAEGLAREKVPGGRTRRVG